MRLAGSEQAQGGVQVCLEGDWVTVCDLGWDDVDATVVCNQLGFTHEGEPLSFHMQVGPLLEHICSQVYVKFCFLEIEFLHLCCTNFVK